jgi:heme/copper-type cytochrome/quinol oxidase subunit 2
MPESNLQPPPGRWGSVLAWAAMLAATVVTIAAALLYEQNRVGDRRVIEIRAQAPEKGNFYPGRIEVVAGERLRLRVRNVDTVGHGFALPALNLGVAEIKPGEDAVFDITVPEQGSEYEFFCTVWCSQDHMRMRGQLVVLSAQARR